MLYASGGGDMKMAFERTLYSCIVSYDVVHTRSYMPHPSVLLLQTGRLQGALICIVVRYTLRPQ